MRFFKVKVDKQPEEYLKTHKKYKREISITR